MTDGGGSGYFWIDTLKNDDKRSNPSIKRVVVYVLLIAGFLAAIIFSAIAIKDNYNKIYNEGLSLLESGETDAAIECFHQIPDYINYKDIKKLIVEYDIDTICPNCGEYIN